MNGSPSVRATLLWTGCFPVLILGGRLQEFFSCARRRHSPVCMAAVAAGCSRHWPAAAHSSANWLLSWFGRRRRLSSPCSAQRPSWERAIGYRLAAPCLLRRSAVSWRLQRQAWRPLVSAKSSWARRQSPTPKPTAAQCTARSPPSQRATSLTELVETEKIHRFHRRHRSSHKRESARLEHRISYSFSPTYFDFLLITGL